MYNTSPAYSFAGKYKVIDKEIKPNPFTYHQENWTPKKTPAWKMGKDKRCHYDVNQNPGPGQYETPKPDRSNKFGIIGKQNGRSKVNPSKSPSPATYTPKQIHTGPAVSFSQKYPNNNSNIFKPGPGSYQRSTTLNTTGSVIGKEKRFSNDKKAKDVPGPGSYECKRPSSASVSFGRQKRDCSKSTKAQQPGPGKYETKSLFEESVISSKGFSMTGKTMIKDLEKRPGPGNYSPDFKKIYSSTPSFSMSQKYKPVSPYLSPAPNSYDVKLSHHSFKTTFNKAKRQPLYNNKNNPGPGSYKPEKVCKSSPKFSIGMSRKSDIKEDFPGPGAYEADKNIVKKRPQSAKIGKSPRCKSKQDLSPGPGDYNMYTIPTSSTPCISFTKDSRMKQTTADSPGPGQYMIRSTVGLVAPYAYK